MYFSGDLDNVVMIRRALSDVQVAAWANRSNCAYATTSSTSTTNTNNLSSLLSRSTILSSNITTATLTPLTTIDTGRRMASVFNEPVTSSALFGRSSVFAQFVC